MLIPRRQDQGLVHSHSSEITPRAVYERRREMLRWMAGGAAGAALASWASREALAEQVARPGKLAPLPGAKSAVAGAVLSEWSQAYGGSEVPGAVLHAFQSTFLTVGFITVASAAVFWQLPKEARTPPREGPEVSGQG